jgi:hypothetical protein
MNLISWSQFGLAGLIAMTLGGVISYVFRLLVRVQTTTMERLMAERDATETENQRLQNRFEEQQRTTLTTLADVAHVMSEVQQMLREREIQQAMEREFNRRKGQADGPTR